MYFLEGFLIGAGMVVFIGPVFFTLLNNALSHGTWGGMAVAFGIAISDVAVAAVCYTGYSILFKNSEAQLLLGITGFVILVVLGLKYFFLPRFYVAKEYEISRRDFWNSFLAGFLVNFVNPFVFAVWIGVIAYGKEHFSPDIIGFLSAVILGIFCMDCSKVFVAGYLKKLLKPKILRQIYRVIGIALIGLGVRMLYLVI